MKSFNDYLKEAALSAKQKKIAKIAGDKDKIDAHDLAALRSGKKPVEEASCSDKDMKKEELIGKQHKLDKNKNGKLDAHDFKLLRKEEAEELDEGKFKEIYTDMMDQATKKGYSSHKQFTPADYDELGKKHNISGKELAVALGHKKVSDVAKEEVDTVKKDASGKVTSWSHEGDWKKSTDKNPAGKAANLAGQALKKTQALSKEEVERIEEKLAQIDETFSVRKTKPDLVAGGRPSTPIQKTKPDLVAGGRPNMKPKVQAEETEQIDELDIATLKSYKKGITRDLDRASDPDNYPHGTGDEAEDRKLNNRVKGDELANKKLKAKGVNPYSEEVEQEMSPYLKATLSVMDEGKIDDLRDAQKLRQAEKSAYDKDFKADTSHPSVTVHKGTSYGGSAQKDDETDEKPETKEKRSAGRPSGTSTGARLKGSKKEKDDIDGREYSLHLPK